MSRRAQISVFIILGILIIAIFGFMYFITAEVGKIKLETQASRIVDAILATTPINYYVTLCLEEATKSALNISGKQGGKIYFSYFDKNVFFDSNNVMYYLDYDPHNETYPEPPAYPCNNHMENFNISPAFCAFLDNRSQFTDLIKTELGTSPVFLPMLCRESNSLCTYGTDGFTGNITVQGAGAVGVVAGFDDGTDSIEKQFEDYIANYTRECSKGILNVSQSNLTAFKKFNITSGEINVSVVFGFNGVEVSADYPLVIKIQDVEPIIRILQFSYFSPVRYKWIYLLARWIAEEELRELDFNITRDWGRSPYNLNNFAVFTNRTGQKDTIVTIKDNDPLHYLRAGPFVFNFAIPNRPPVLDYIPGSYVQQEYASVINRSYDVYVVENSVIELNPKAHDPDGDEISYNYSGWKETEDAYFDEDAYSDCRENPQRCVIDTASAPHNWTNSNLYYDSFPSASYQTNHSDIGNHNVTICAYEAGNPSMSDCQTVRILVDDEFIVIANMSYCFPGITNHSLISIEDPICLDADVIDYFNPEVTSYIWNTNRDSGGQLKIYDGPNQFVTLPRDYPQDALKYLPGLIDYFSLIGMKTFKLGVLRGLGPHPTSGTAEVNATAKKCTPYRSDVPSFPFNNLSYDGRYSYPTMEDPFKGNHTCCEGDLYSPTGEDWGYASSTNECFKYEEYGLYNADFLDITAQINSNPRPFDFVVTPLTPTYTKESGTYNTPFDDNLKNDIMHRIFTSYCSGASGNVCGDEIQDTYVNITPCADLNPNINQIRRCQGGNLTAQHFETGMNPQCINFKNTTFEAYIGTATVDDAYLCAPARCSAKNDTLDGYGKLRGYDDAFYLCKATCYDGTCQKPVECENCRDKSLGVKDPQTNPLIPNFDYITKQRLHGFSGSCSIGSPDYCDFTSKTFDLNDSCQNGDILVEQQLRQIKDQYPDYNYSEEYSCSNLETPAIISNGVCTPGNKSVCSDGACVLTQDAQINEKCENRMFFGVETQNSNGLNVAESCRYAVPVDPDSAGDHACQVCGGFWDTTQNCCCGDDGESGTGGSCSVRCHQ